MGDVKRSICHACASQPRDAFCNVCDAALAREAALREELATSNKVGTAIGETLGRVTAERDDLHKRLTAAEHWSGTLERAIFRALDDSSEDAETGAIEITRADYEALAILIGEPTESGASE